MNPGRASRIGTTASQADCGTVTIPTRFDPGNVELSECNVSTSNVEIAVQNNNSAAANVSVTWTANGTQIGSDSATIDAGLATKLSATPEFSALAGGTTVSVTANVSVSEA